MARRQGRGRQDGRQGRKHGPQGQHTKTWRGDEANKGPQQQAAGTTREVQRVRKESARQRNLALRQARDAKGVYPTLPCGEEYSCEQCGECGDFCRCFFEMEEMMELCAAEVRAEHASFVFFTVQ